jgi:SAM-dependent methyltransferase
MGDDRWWKGFDAVIAASVPAGARILDIGCGDGGLVDKLAELGFDTLGVDPRAPTHRRLIQAQVEHATGLGDFDAITATMALHHADLAAVAQALDRTLRPHGQLFVNEFAWDAYDERAAAWLADNDPSDSDNSIAAWCREHADLHSDTTIQQMLSGGFRPTLGVGRPYLARMLGRHDLEVEEHALIDAQLLPALGRWYIARRR